MDKAIVFVNSYDFTKTNASLFRLLAIARGLIENGVDVYWILLASKPTKEIITDPYYKKIVFITLGKHFNKYKRNKYLFYLYRNLQVFKVNSLICVLKKQHKTLACYTYGDEFFLNYFLAKICKKQKIQIYNETTEYPKLIDDDLNNIKKIRLYIRSQLYLKYFITNVDHIFVISKALKQFFDTHLKKYKKKIPVSVLNMMVEPVRYSCSYSSSDSKYKDIVFVGSMYGDQNGVYYLLEAFLKIYNDYPECRLIIIGDNTRTSRMQKINQLMNNNLDTMRIIFTGQLDRKSVIEKINSAYCLVLARPNNIQAKYGFPTKLGEYLSTGKPIVITSVGEIPLYLKDGMNAYIAKPDDVNSFADKLRECLNDPKKASLIGKKGQELVYKEFNYCECTKIIVRSI